VLHPEITADPERLGRIVCAARRLMEFGHPGIARVLEITGPDAGSGAMSIVAEWVDGESLSDRMLRRSFDESETIRIGASVAAAVAAAHQHDLAGLGIDPAHVLITPTGSVGLVGLEPDSQWPERTEDEARRDDLAAIVSLMDGLNRRSVALTPGYAKLIDAFKPARDGGPVRSSDELAVHLARLAGPAGAVSRRWVGPAVVSTVALMLLVAALVGAAANKEQPSGAVAVLPFETDSRDADAGNFGIGLADSITGHLSRAQSLIVRPMSAVMQVCSHVNDPREAGRRLQASLVLVGRYTREENPRVDVRLIEASTGATLWKQQFSSVPDDPRLIEEAVVEALLNRLHPGAAPALPGEASTRGRPDPVSHHLYLLARGRMARYESRSIAEVVRLLEQATANDPDYASAQAALAEASANMFLGGMSSDRAWLSRAIAAGRRAVKLDDADPAAHYALGYALRYSGDPISGACELMRSIEIDPTYPAGLRLTSALLAQTGALRPARLLRDRALQVDPTIYPGWVDVYLATGEGNVAEAARLFEAELDHRRREGLSIEMPVQNLGFMAFETGDAAAGLRWAAMLEEISADYVYADLVRLLAFSRMGDAATVGNLLDRGRSAYWADWEYSLWVGRALALVGNNEAAITWLVHSAALGSYDLASFRRVELSGVFREDLRYQQALTLVRGRAQAIVDRAALAGFR
jgi:TolB-like protein/tetratricopeptide (TPR) repeat protein